MMKLIEKPIILLQYKFRESIRKVGVEQYETHNDKRAETPGNVTKNQKFSFVG